MIEGFVSRKLKSLSSFSYRTLISRWSLTTLSSTKTSDEIKLPQSDRRYYWDLSRVAFSLLPLYPGIRRKTLVETIVPDTIWTFDQLQGIINVNVPVRSVVVKLKEGGLLVYNPVAPTLEMLDELKKLTQRHGPVKHVVLGTIGLEHKAFLGSFCKYFPLAKVWVQPGQWSFPFNLPNSFLGFPLGDRIQEIPQSSDQSVVVQPAPWADEFEIAVLGPLKFKSVGGFSETAVFHKPTRTMLVTDVVVKVADRPSPILEEDPRALLFHSRDNMLDEVKDTLENRLRGWRRMVLFGLTFFPSGIQVRSLFETLSDIPKLPPQSNLLGQGAVPLSGGLYPWRWERSELDSFRALQGGLLVAPILRELILNREPDIVLQWVKQVKRWPIERIIPSHLENNIRTTSSEFAAAFQFLGNNPETTANTALFNLFPIGKKTKRLNAEPEIADLKLLKTLSEIFTQLGVVAPVPRS